MLICFVISSILKTSNSKCSEKHYIGCLGDEYLQQYSFFDAIFFHSSPQYIYLFIGMYFIVKHTNDFEIQTQSQNFPDNPRIPLIPNFYIAKLGYAGNTYFSYLNLKHRLWVHARTTEGFLACTYNLCFGAK